MRRVAAIAAVLVIAVAIVWLFADGRWNLGPTILNERGPAFVPWRDGEPDFRSNWRGKWTWRPSGKPPVTLSFLRDGSALIWFDPDAAPLRCAWEENSSVGTVRIRRESTHIEIMPNELGDRAAWRLLSPLGKP